MVAVSIYSATITNRIFHKHFYFMIKTASRAVARMQAKTVWCELYPKMKEEKIVAIEERGQTQKKS